MEREGRSVVGRGTLIRAAHHNEAALLSDLALRSKAHWGYDEAFMDACRWELTVPPERIEREIFNLLEQSGAVCGFYCLNDAQRDDSGGDRGAGSEDLGGARSGARGDSGFPARQVAELDLFYVDPACIGRGHGRRLWRHMIATARRGGYKRVLIHSDPHAEGFYRAMGARRVGDVASGSIPGRSLPLMRIDLE